MPITTANGIELAYSIAGHDNALPLLIVAGLGVQMNQGMLDFIPALVDRGFKVITFDNRDVGLQQTRPVGARRHHGGIRPGARQAGG